MSRLIIKNLPVNLKAEKLQEIFSQHGNVTDVKLMFTKRGKFRKFGFIGFQQECEAEKAKKVFNNTLILNQKVVIETCRDFGVKEKVNSKHTSDQIKKLSKEKNVKQDDSTDKTSDSDLAFLKLKKNSSLLDDDLKSDMDKSVTPRYSIQMRGCPFTATEQQINEFFYPLKPINVDFLPGKNDKPSGLVMVDFSEEKAQNEALCRNGDYMGKRYIELKKFIHHQSYNKDNMKQSDFKKMWMDRISKNHQECEIEDISESGRLYVRNLSYACSEDDLTALFQKFGVVSEVNIPIDVVSKKCIGYGFVTFMFPEHAVLAFNELDGTVFQGRMLHILPAKDQVQKDKIEGDDAKSSFKKSKASADIKSSQSSHNWNSLFMGTNAVAEAISEKYGVDKSDIMDSTSKHSTAVRMALGETHIVKETRDFLVENGISLDVFSQPNAERSKTVILAKNLPVGATSSELRDMFEEFAELGRVVLAPAGVTAVIECLQPTEARKAFTKLAYRKFHHAPLYLEWAPVGTFSKKTVEKSSSEPTANLDASSEVVDSDQNPGFTLFVKNLNFETTEEGLKAHFEKHGPLLMSMISKKKTHKSDSLLSMGYGFVTFKNPSDGKNALRTLQHSTLDEYKLELKISERKQPVKTQSRKKQETKEQKTSKILIRNIPFQANASEITSLFKSFGELKTVRLPKKLTATLGQTGGHRGFAFVDFVTKEDAKNAFNALCHSTHLYGRRLVLEWADTEESSVNELRRKTITYFHHDKSKKSRLSTLEDAVAAAEVGGDDE